MSEKAIEQEIQDKGLNAPRLTPDHIDASITGEQYFVFPGTTVTICLLTLTNGFTVTGESACASPENFDEEIGRKIAHENARDKIWQLEGYLLKDKLHHSEEFEARTGNNCVMGQVHSHEPRDNLYILREILGAGVGKALRKKLENKISALVDKI